MKHEIYFRHPEGEALSLLPKFWGCRPQDALLSIEFARPSRKPADKICGRCRALRLRTA